MNIGASFRLMRFHKPTGILLLWAPVAWALWLANQGHPPIKLSLLFYVGTIVMRAAGCVMNDIADRHIDCHVQRTRLRPLACGQTQVIQALGLLLFLLLIALAILINLPVACGYYAVIALIVMIIYPFGKRLIKAPQLVLGIAFSMGIPMVYVASYGIDKSMYYLLLINFIWVLVYDTQYALADKNDDLTLGINSTAILFGRFDRIIIGILQLFLHIMWLKIAIVSVYLTLSFMICWLIGAVIFIFQQYLLAFKKEQLANWAFSTNGYYGLVMWLGLIISAID